MSNGKRGVVLCPGPSLSGMLEPVHEAVAGCDVCVVVNRALTWAEDNAVPYNAVAALDPLLFGGRQKGVEGAVWDGSREQLVPSSIARWPWATLHVLAYSCALVCVPYWSQKHRVERAVGDRTHPAESLPRVLPGAERPTFSAQAALLWLAECFDVKEIIVFGMDLGSTGNTYYDGRDVAWSEGAERWGFERQITAATMGYVYGKHGCSVHREQPNSQQPRVVPLDGEQLKEAKQGGAQQCADSTTAHSAVDCALIRSLSIRQTGRC